MKELKEIGLCNPLIFQVRSQVQRAVDHHLGGGRVQLQAEAGLQAGAGPQHHAGRHSVNISVRNKEQRTRNGTQTNFCERKFHRHSNILYSYQVLPCLLLLIKIF